MKTNFLPHLAGRVFGVPLLIQPQKLEVILHVIGPRLGITAAAPEGEDDELLSSVAEKPYQVTPDGIAIIGISGTLVKKASWLDAASGLQSYASIERQFADAVNDPRINGILLDVDSPGGEVGGLFELADVIYGARKQKPTYAIANDDAFSAAYALASSAERLFVTRTGGVGSVGVIALHLDQSAYDEKIGRKYTAVFAGARKNDYTPHEPLSDAAHETLQAEVNRLYDIFVQTVVRNRDIGAAAVRSTEAGLYFGENAIGAGLANEVGTANGALAALRLAIADKQLRVAASAATQIPKETKRMDQETIEQQADATRETVDVAAVEARLRAEYEEIAALCKIAGKPGLTAEMIAGKKTVAQVREHLLALQAAESERSAVQSQVQPTPAGAEAQLTAVAQQIAATKGIAFAQAYVQALNQNPKLYSQYLAERSAAVKPN